MKDQLTYNFSLDEFRCRCHADIGTITGPLIWVY